MPNKKPPTPATHSETDDRVRQFLTTVGGPRMMQKLGVSDRMLRHAARANRMPARWFEAAKEAAAEVGVPEPDTQLFEFRRNGDD